MRAEDLASVEKLREGLNQLSVMLNERQQDTLLRYLELLSKWNRVYNLTAVRNPAKMLTIHLLDSLSALPYLRGHRIADVGTGAGLPGIPLAIARPDWHFTLLESRAKKSRFLVQAALELALHNLEIIRSRSEDFHPVWDLDTVICRALASLGDFLSLGGHLGSKGTIFIAMKGKLETRELVEIPENFQITDVHAIHVPGITAPRNVVCIRRYG